MAKLACYFVHVSGPRILDTDGREKLEWTVGRALDSDICLNSKPAVSKTHGLIRFFPETRAWQVLDCGSLNGTWVSGQRITSSVWHNLSEGDTIDFGTLAARCRVSFDTDDTLRTLEEEAPTPSKIRDAAVATVSADAEPEAVTVDGHKMALWDRLLLLAKDFLDWLQEPITLSGAIYRIFVLVAFLTAMSVVVIHK